MGLANRETGLKEADSAGRGGAAPSRVFAGVSGSWEDQNGLHFQTGGEVPPDFPEEPEGSGRVKGRHGEENAWTYVLACVC